MGSVGGEAGRCVRGGGLNERRVSASRGTHSAGGAPARFIDAISEEAYWRRQRQDALSVSASSGEDGRCARGSGLNERRVSASRGTHSAGGAPSEVIDAMNEEPYRRRQRQGALSASASSGEDGRCVRGSELNERRVSASRGTHSAGGASSEVIVPMNGKLHIEYCVRDGIPWVAVIEKLGGGKLIAALTSPRRDLVDPEDFSVPAACDCLPPAITNCLALMVERATAHRADMGAGCLWQSFNGGDGWSRTTDLPGVATPPQTWRRTRLRLPLVCPPQARQNTNSPTSRKLWDASARRPSLHDLGHPATSASTPASMATLTMFLASRCKTLGCH